MACDTMSAVPMKLSWRKGKPAPVSLNSVWGAAVLHGNTAFFSHGCDVYSYKVHEDKWTELQQCEYQAISLAILHDTLTTVGGRTTYGTPTNILLSLSQSGSGWKWERYLPPMLTERILPATVTITTHLVVAAGQKTSIHGLSTVEVLDTETRQWSMASSLPRDIGSPQMVLCSGYVYLSDVECTIFSCSVEGLLQSCQLPPHKPTSINSSESGSIWTSQARIPLDLGSGGCGLVTLGEHVLAIGGEDLYPTAKIHCYDRATNSWSVIGEMPTPRYNVLGVYFPSNELVVVGGSGIMDNDTTENAIGNMDEHHYMLDCACARVN